MEINLCDWQKKMLEEVLDKLDRNTIKIIEEAVSVVRYGSERIGNGHYREETHWVTISHGIQHPRYFIELVFHEIGHGVVDVLYKHKKISKEQSFDHLMADGLPLILFYPEALKLLGRKDIEEIYRKEVFGGKVPAIDIDALVKKYEDIVKNELQEQIHSLEMQNVAPDTIKAEYEFATTLYEKQKDGYIKRFLKW